MEFILGPETKLVTTRDESEFIWYFHLEDGYYGGTDYPSWRPAKENEVTLYHNQMRDLHLAVDNYESYFTRTIRNDIFLADPIENDDYAITIGGLKFKLPYYTLIDVIENGFE